MLRALFVGSAALMVLGAYASAEAATTCATVRCKPGYSCMMSGRSAKCAACAGLTFTKKWTTTKKGTLRAGGCVMISYSGDRGNITNSHGGAPCWGIQGYVKFPPSNAVQEFKAMDFVNYYGRISNMPDPKYYTTLTIPAGSKSIELWFRRWTACDSPREQWDSNNSQNYKFPVK